MFTELPRSHKYSTEMKNSRDHCWNDNAFFSIDLKSQTLTPWEIYSISSSDVFALDARSLYLSVTLVPLTPGVN